MEEKKNRFDENIFISERKDNKYILRLYIAGMSSKSKRAIDNLRRILEENLKGLYELEVIDMYDNPEFAKEGQIIASPTLIKNLPPPLRRFVGDMSNKDRILLGLGEEKEE
ncbi:MAG: circadian clock KaiB family protein [Methanobacterium sp.]